MVEWIDWEHVDVVVEYGAGTGVFTEHIISRKRPETTFLAIEIEPDFADKLKHRFPDVHVYQESVANIKTICDQENIRTVDAVICGLPWAAFSETDQDAYLDAMFTVLKPQGQFVTFAYLQGLLMPAGQRFKRKLSQHFSEVQYSDTVWPNLPPAFVYRCRR